MPDSTERVYLGRYFLLFLAATLVLQLSVRLLGRLFGLPSEFLQSPFLLGGLAGGGSVALVATINLALRRGRLRWLLRRR